MSDEATPGTEQGVVHRTGGGVYEVVTDVGRALRASLRGRLKRESRAGGVVVGDRVALERVGDAWRISAVEPRTAELIRRAGRDAKVVAANLTDVFAVVSVAGPRASATLVDRLLAIGEACGLHPRLVVNKADLDPEGTESGPLADVYRSIGYAVHVTSAATGLGIVALADEMCRGTSAVIGPSGAGKSSLLNAIDPSLALRTGELSRKTGTGKHTTVSSRLIRLACGGLVADTPGFGDVGLWGVAEDRVEGCFPELAEPASHCRFRGCSHVHEPDCGVREAVDSGAVLESRYRSYVTLREEAVGR